MNTLINHDLKFFRRNRSEQGYLMIRYGASAQEMQSMPAREIFMLRLNLLIIMSKAYLKSNPLGGYRKKALINTARFVFSAARAQAMQLASASNDSIPASGHENQHIQADKIFLQRTQLLAVMANAFANGQASGRQRKQAMADNIDQICDYLSSRHSLAGTTILKVA